MADYLRKVLYFNEDKLDIYEFLEKKGRNANKYIFDLIKEDMKKENKDFKNKINELDIRINELYKIISSKDYGIEIEKFKDEEIKELSQLNITIQDLEFE